uniref:Ferritin n=1 Tax=Felis catus TaxID=9685 RepID=A0ABI7XFV4_FELCA
MGSQAQKLLSEACRVAVNYLASYELNVSDAYLTMSYYYDEETEAPLYLPFFEDQIEVKKEHAKQFITYLREHRSKICLPVIKRPDIDNWGTGIQAIESALQLENTLNKLLQDLMNLASQNSETDLLNFLKKFLAKQKRNINYLEYQRSYQKELDRLTEKEVTPEKPGEASGCLLT